MSTETTADELVRIVYEQLDELAASAEEGTEFYSYVKPEEIGYLVGLAEEHGWAARTRKSLK